MVYNKISRVQILPLVFGFTTHQFCLELQVHLELQPRIHEGTGTVAVGCTGTVTGVSLLVTMDPG